MDRGTWNLAFFASIRWVLTITQDLMKQMYKGNVEEYLAANEFVRRSWYQYSGDEDRPRIMKSLCMVSI